MIYNSFVYIRVNSYQRQDSLTDSIENHSFCCAVQLWRVEPCCSRQARALKTGPGLKCSQIIVADISWVTIYDAGPVLSQRWVNMFFGVGTCWQWRHINAQHHQRQRSINPALRRWPSTKATHMYTGFQPRCKRSQKSESAVCVRQNMTSKIDPRTERVKHSECVHNI